MDEVLCKDIKQKQLLNNDILKTFSLYTVLISDFRGLWLKSKENGHFTDIACLSNNHTI